MPGDINMQCNFILQTDGKYKCDKCGFIVPRQGHKVCRGSTPIIVDMERIQQQIKKVNGCGSCGNKESRKEGLEK
jgi:hypothetical protein